MLISKDMVVKGCFSQPKIFKIIFSFLGQKIAFKNISHTLEDFSKFDRPFKSTVTKGTMEPINQEIRLKIQEKRIQMSKALTKFKLSLSTFFNRTWSVGIKYTNLKHKIMIFVNFAKFRPTLLIWVQKNGCYGHN